MSDLLSPRSIYKPFAYPWAFKAYEEQQTMHWLPKMVPLAEDVHDWNYRLTTAEKNLLTQLFRFFTQGDVDVAAAYHHRYIPAFQHPEVTMMLSCIATSEANHVHSYSLLLDTVGMPETEYQAFAAFEEMRAKHEYLFAAKGEELNDRARLALDIAVFSAFSEGMQLFSSFAMLMNFQRLGKMKGMSTIVEWSIRDESHHVESMIKLFHVFISENPEIWTDQLKAMIYQACRDMVELEDGFIDLAFAEGGIEGMTSQEVKTYIRYIADRRLNMLGLKSNYGITSNPFDWLDWIITAQTHTNFFEQRSTEYGKAGLEGWDTAVCSDGWRDHYTIMSKPGCPWCDKAKTLLDKMGVAYDVVTLSQEDRRDFHKAHGTTTMPQVFRGDQLIGGFDDLSAHLLSTRANTT